MRKKISSVIDYLFDFLFIIAILCLFALASIGLYLIIKSIIKNFGHPSISEIIKGIEYLFISPLPMLIIAAFHGHYKNTIARTFQDEKGVEKQLDLRRARASLNLGVTKYLFISIAISTILTVLLEKIFSVNQPDNICGCPNSFYCFLQTHGPVLSIATLTIILLLLYLKVIAKHVNHDTENLIKFRESSQDSVFERLEKAEQRTMRRG